MDTSSQMIRGLTKLQSNFITTKTPEDASCTFRSVKTQKYLYKNNAMRKPSPTASFLTRHLLGSAFRMWKKHKDPLPDAFSFGFNSTCCQPGKRLRSGHRARLAARSFHLFSRINECALCVHCMLRARWTTRTRRNADESQAFGILEVK